jgi:hypothetical protein
MNQYPLTLSAYYLDFSFPGAMKLETRFFIYIPFQGEYIQGNQSIKLIELGFDMNSVFNAEGYKSKDNIDLGLNILIDIRSIYLPKKDTFQYFINQLSENNENVKENHLFPSEKDLYSSIRDKVKEFLEKAYSKENWLKFVKERIAKNNKKISFSDEEQTIYLNNQSAKIDNFINETLNRVDAIFNSSIIDEDFFNKYRITLKQHAMSIVNQILSSVPLEEITHVQELNKMVKTYQFYSLNNELPRNKSNPLPRHKI